MARLVPKGTQKYLLWQNAEGKWCCKIPQLPSSHAENNSPNEVVENANHVLKEFNAFTAHMHGECEPASCELCQEGKMTRGIGGPRNRKNTPPCGSSIGPPKAD